MRKFQTFLFFTVLTLTSYSQEKVSVYKSVADTFISNYFDSSIISQIKCTEVAIYGLDDEIIYFAETEEAKDRVYKISSIAFFYSFYSKELNHTLDFEVSIGESKEIIDDSTLIASVPNCISKNLGCNFITKDSAIIIAIKDSILYPNNIEAALYKHYKSFNYFWFVRSSPILEIPKRRTATKRTSQNQKRIINASTGELVSQDDYYGQ